jgi:trans-aconitate 2-methyltransferase
MLVVAQDAFANLLERLPRGRVIAVDRSANMRAEAAAYLTPRFCSRVTILQGDVQYLQLSEPADAIFSTATFHWVLDHPQLFRTLFECLRPGGRLVAQRGGGPNIARLRERAEALLTSEDYREKAAGWSNPWEFATPEATALRLTQTGFIDIETDLELAPTGFLNGSKYHEFVRSVVLRAHLDALPDAAPQDAFMSDITAMAARDDPAFTLDYWRLNLAATRPRTP